MRTYVRPYIHTCISLPERGKTQHAWLGLQYQCKHACARACVCVCVRACACAHACAVAPTSGSAKNAPNTTNTPCQDQREQLQLKMRAVVMRAVNRTVWLDLNGVYLHAFQCDFRLQAQLRIFALHPLNRHGRTHAHINMCMHEHMRTCRRRQPGALNAQGNSASRPSLLKDSVQATSRKPNKHLLSRLLCVHV